MREEEAEQKEDKKEEAMVGKRSEENLAKVAISKEADRALGEILNRVCDGFDAGRPTKHEVTSMFILRFFKSLTDTDIHSIRAGFFDPIALMEVTLKRAKETGLLPDSLREMLYKEFLAATGAPPKKSKKNLNADIIKDNVSEERESA